MQLYIKMCNAEFGSESGFARPSELSNCSTRLFFFLPMVIKLIEIISDMFISR